MRVQAGLESRSEAALDRALFPSAGLEELKEKMADRLTGLRKQLEEKRGGQPFVWETSDGPMEKMILEEFFVLPEDRIFLRLLYVIALLLDRPDSSADEELRETLRILDQEILEPIQETKHSDWSSEGYYGNMHAFVEVLPTAEDWLFSPLVLFYEDDDQFARHHTALARLSARASALAFGRNGPHQRSGGISQVDEEDVQTAPALLGGFIRHLDNLLAQVEGASGKGQANEQIKREARDYLGALWSGLMVGVGRDLNVYRSEYYEPLWRESNRHGVDFADLLIRGVELFPDFLPVDRVPEFLIHSPDQVFADDEILMFLAPHNQASGDPPLTLWDITVGRDEAKRYLQGSGVQQWKDEDDKQYLEQIYYFLQGVDPPGAGLEESTEVKLKQLAEALPGEWLLVIPTWVLKEEDKGWLEELLRLEQLPADFKKRVLLFGEDFEVRQLAGQHRIPMVASEDVLELATALMSWPEEGNLQVHYLGDEVTVDALRRMLPQSIEVDPIEPTVGLRELFLALGVPKALLDFLKVDEIERALAPGRAV